MIPTKMYGEKPTAKILREGSRVFCVTTHRAVPGSAALRIIVSRESGTHVDRIQVVRGMGDRMKVLHDEPVDEQHSQYIVGRLKHQYDFPCQD